MITQQREVKSDEENYNPAPAHCSSHHFRGVSSLFNWQQLVK
jgi:hypothetical protein